MGSYLTIVNDTSDPWHCKVGADTRALKWAMIATSVIATVAATVVTGGLSLLIGMDVGAAYGIVNIAPIAMLASVPTAIAGVVVGGTTTQIANVVAKSVTKELDARGYDVIEAGESKRYGKMTLSLWRQCNCIKVATNGTNVTMDSVLMAPIFSGATAGSNRNHSIAWWLARKGAEQEVIKALPNHPTTNSS